MDRLCNFNVQQFLQMALEQIELIKRKKAAYIDNSILLGGISSSPLSKPK
jgi:hypothetical protein